jgi:pectinesterase
MQFKYLFVLSFFITTSLPAQQDISDMRWSRVVYNQPDEWYGSEEAVRIAENVLLYQRNIGGWPKNMPMHHVLSKKEKKELLKLQSVDEDATTDNGATVMELNYLSRVYGATGNETYKAAFLKGIDYLIEAQYPNGGWPQFYPLKNDYSRHITFNDGSMVNIMRVMHAIAQKSDAFSIVADEQTVLKAKQAYEKGLEIILESQYKQNGVLTVWCAQHDEVTLEPVRARTYELPSLSGAESVGIVLLLMEIDNPSPEVVNAIQSAVRWFEKTQIHGIRVETFQTEDGKRDRRVVPDDMAPALWARFYGLSDNRPFFCDRDGIKKYSLAEIGHERRNGYSWYTRAPQAALDAYGEWQSRWAPARQPGH